MFTAMAQYYDKLYSCKDYSAEASELCRLLAKHHPTATRILDVACGTGEHARHLGQWFSVDGIDISRDFVAIATHKHPHGRFAVADMCEFDLQKRYDAVICLFGSIGYVRTPQRLKAALGCFKQHLLPGGVVLVEPWFTPDTFSGGQVHLVTWESEDLKLCRMGLTEREGMTSRVRFQYLIGGREGIRHETERHELGLFTVEQMLDAFDHAGLEAHYHPEVFATKGLYVARRWE